MTKVSACIVNYRDCEHTEQAVRSLLEQTKKVELTVYVVDNASNDGSAERLREMFPQITVLALDKNEGFGVGHNAVLPLLDSEYHAVVNPDILLRQDVLSIMADYFDKNPDIGIGCPTTYNTDGTIQYLPRRQPSVHYLLSGRVPGMEQTRARYTMQDEDLNETKDVDFVTGCFMFMRTELFKKVGGFDTRYFMYIEDADLTRKIKQYARAVYFPGAAVTHAWSRKSKKSLKYFMIHVNSVLKYMRKWKKEEKKKKV